MSGPAPPGHRAGVVALLGRPNAGKSTLLNRLLGEKLAIVTPKPQTTRSRLLGILTRPDAQLLLVDTPGFLEGGRPLEAAMRAVAEEAARDCDVALLLVDAVRGWEPEHAAWLARITGQGTAVVLVATRCDRPGAAERPWPPPGTEAAAGAVRTSAVTGEGLEDLVARTTALLPEAPPYYPEEELTDRPLRFLAAEAVREAAFQALGQELPYRIAVEVTRFDESDPDLARIDATLLVERDSQKRIVIGSGGAQIKSIGMEARREIERLLGRQVHLALWVKVEPGWARKPKRLKSLGYC